MNNSDQLWIPVNKCEQMSYENIKIKQYHNLADACYGDVLELLF